MITLLFLYSNVYAQGSAESYPVRPVTWILAAAAGGGIDFESRLYAQKLGDIFGKNFVIDYKPGAGATIGAAYVAKAAPDGYTIISLSPSHTISALVYPNLPFDINKDFSPISLTSKRPSLIMVHPSVPARTLAEYIAYVKARPTQVNVGTAGKGEIGDLALHWLHWLGGMEVTYIQYKGGAPSYTALVSGEIQFTLGSPAAMVGNIRSGKVRLLAVSTRERIKLFPDVPTVDEQGLAGFDYAQWIGVAAPARTPTTIINRLSFELAKIVKLPEVLQKLSDDGTIMIGSTPEQMRQYLADESARWRKVVVDAGLNLAE